MTELTHSDAGNSQAFAALTLSLMMDSTAIDGFIAHVTSGLPQDKQWAKWDKHFLRDLEKTHCDTGLLRSSIEPMFEDIADRSRNLFVTDFLIDADSMGEVEIGQLLEDARFAPYPRKYCGNISRVVDVSFPHQIHWATEGVNRTINSSAGTREQDKGIAFEGVVCRSFWIAHSNCALSFHISFEIPLPDRQNGDSYLPNLIRTCYGLSLFQKAIFPTENTEWLVANGQNGSEQATLMKLTDRLLPRISKTEEHDCIEAWRWKEDDPKKPETSEQAEILSPGEKQYGLTEFVEHELSRQLNLLFESVNKAKRQNPLPVANGTHGNDKSWRIGVGQMLCYTSKSPETGNSKKSRPWTDKKQWNNRRLLVVLQDHSCFQLVRQLQESSGDSGIHTQYIEQAAQRICDANIGVEQIQTADARTNANESAEKHPWTVDGIHKELKAEDPDDDELARFGGVPNSEALFLLFFMSGFFQNIIDFFAQDWLEVQDGISPLYPTEDSSRDLNKGFILYATPHTTFELVDASRSLSRGRGMIGTCPYVFLAHIISFQNEVLTKAYEVEVTQLIDNLAATGFADLGDARQPAHAYKLGAALKEFKKYRLNAFEKVHKHLSLNVFRYPTEQTFFDELQKIRGVEQRRSYWDAVVDKLSQTIEGLRDEQQRRQDQKLNRLVLAIAVLGFFQVVFQVHDSLLSTAKEKDEVSLVSADSSQPDLDRLDWSEDFLVMQERTLRRIRIRNELRTSADVREYCGELAKAFAKQQAEKSEKPGKEEKLHWRPAAPGESSGAERKGKSDAEEHLRGRIQAKCLEDQLLENEKEHPDVHGGLKPTTSEQGSTPAQSKPEQTTSALNGNSSAWVQFIGDTSLWLLLLLLVWLLSRAASDIFLAIQAAHKVRQAQLISSKRKVSWTFYFIVYVLVPFVTGSALIVGTCTLNSLRLCGRSSTLVDFASFLAAVATTAFLTFVVSSFESVAKRVFPTRKEDSQQDGLRTCFARLRKISFVSRFFVKQRVDIPDDFIESHVARLRENVLPLLCVTVIVCLFVWLLVS